MTEWIRLRVNRIFPIFFICGRTSDGEDEEDVPRDGVSGLEPRFADAGELG
jgi:hypothetical protein